MKAEEAEEEEEEEEEEDEEEEEEEKERRESWLRCGCGMVAAQRIAITAASYSVKVRARPSEMGLLTRGDVRPSTTAMREREREREMGERDEV